MSKKQKYCKKCGLPVGFARIPNGKGTWRPTNLNGTDHWDICREERFKNPEYRAYIRNLDKERMKPKTTDRSNGQALYSGDIPPWDNALV